jgi:hypothetical protein
MLRQYDNSVGKKACVPQHAYAWRCKDHAVCFSVIRDGFPTKNHRDFYSFDATFMHSFTQVAFLIN